MSATMIRLLGRLANRTLTLAQRVKLLTSRCLQSGCALMTVLLLSSHAAKSVAVDGATDVHNRWGSIPKVLAFHGRDQRWLVAFFALSLIHISEPTRLALI
eukprot:2001700-Alexandrium_andersonii.AAC.1